MATGYSQAIDKYYSLLDEGLTTKKPARALTNWFRSLCEQIASRPTPGWSEMTSALLSVLPNEQRELEKHVRKVAAKLRSGKPLPNGHDSIALTGPPWMNVGLIFQARLGSAKGKEFQNAKSLASGAFEQDHVERCVIVVVNAAGPELSYLGGSVWYRADRKVTETVFL